MEKTTTLVIYDVQNTRAREKMAEACLDMGLERIQFSAFRGGLTFADRKELARRLERFLGEGSGRFFVLPVCAQDWRQAFSREQGNNEHGLASHHPTHETVFHF